MNHPLSVYTAFYAAVIFVSVSIWGGKLSELTGDLALLAGCVGIFSLKVSIDDYIHFHKGGEKLCKSLYLSLLMFLLLAASIALTASGRGRLGCGAFALAFVLGCAWLTESGLSGPDSGHRRFLFAVNLVSIGLLMWASFGPPGMSFDTATAPLGLLMALLLFDFIWGRTIQRLAKLAGPS